MAGLGNRKWKHKTSDGVIQTETVFQPHENKLYVETTQPNKTAILRNNQRLANQSRDHREIRRGLRIPEEDFPIVCERYPDLIKGTREEQQAAMGKIMEMHPEYVVVQYQRKYF